MLSMHFTNESSKLRTRTTFMKNVHLQINDTYTKIPNFQSAEGQHLTHHSIFPLSGATGKATQLSLGCKAASQHVGCEALGSTAKEVTVRCCKSLKIMKNAVGLVCCRCYLTGKLAYLCQRGKRVA